MGDLSHVANVETYIKVDNCPICDENRRLLNKFGCFLCFYCNNFFESTVVNTELPFCENEGYCDVFLGYINKCGFCTMSKCYLMGMKYWRVPNAATIEQRIMEIDKGPYRSGFGYHLSHYVTAVTKCLDLMAQHYYEWLSFSSAYRNLDIGDKAILREKSCIRGAVLQLMERSYVAHDVLWLHNCFFHSKFCFDASIRIVTSMILHFIQDCKRMNIGMTEFLRMKLKLALLHDVTIEAEENIPSHFYDKISDIEEEVRFRESIGQTIFSLPFILDPERISNSRMFLYKENPYLCRFPEHNINVRHLPNVPPF